MNVTAGELRDGLLQCLADDIQVESGSDECGEWLLVVLPVNFDAPEAFVRPVGGCYEVSDDGMTLSDLETVGMEPTSGEVRRVAEHVGLRYGFRIDGETRSFVRTVGRKEELGRAVHDLGQLVLTLRGCEEWKNRRPWRDEGAAAGGGSE